MADQTTHLAQIDMSQAQKEVTANGLFDAMSPASYGGRRAEACSGLVWGYYGGRFGGAVVANGTLTLEPSETTYVVMDRSDGSILLDEGSSSNGAWDDTGNYARLYALTSGATSITDYEDHRFGTGGLYDPSVGAGAGDMVLASAQIVTGAKTFDDGTLKLAGSTSGAITLAAPAAAGSGTVTFPATGTLATLAGVEEFSNKTVAGNAIGYLGIPQNSKSAAYTTVLGDAGKHLLHPSADTSARTFTIDSNANVAYPVGTAITFVNQNGAGVLTIAITSDTIRLAGAGTTGSRTLAANGVATAIKITSTEWIISGQGLS